jgi:shikimate kinase
MDMLLASLNAHLNKPIVMIGLMGAGKTKIGGLLAEALAWPFVDADHEIEAAAGCSIADIFETHGEAAFRDLERKVLARLMSDDLKIIATGGGAVMNEQTAALVWEKSLSIWLKADLAILVERTGRNDKRPLLKNGDPAEILQGLMDKRYPIYSKADITVESSIAEAEITLQERLLPQLVAYVEKNYERT